MPALLASALLLLAPLAVLTSAPAAHAAPGTLSFVGASSTVGNRVGHTVRIPADVRAGDALVLFLTATTTAVTIADLPGWTLLQTRDGNGHQARAWTRIADAGSANSNLTVETSDRTKAIVAVSAYRSTATPAVTASAVAGSNSTTSSHRAPDVEVGEPGSWVVNLWSEKSSTEAVAEKSSTTTAWSLPSSTTQRAATASTGNGKVSLLLGDEGPVPLGIVPSRTATTDPEVNRTVAFSAVIDPGTDTSAVNEPPTADFSVGCAGMTCDFDASLSFDPDLDDSLSYAWDFGDGRTGTGQGLSGYGLGDAVVRRDHVGALNPADGTALEWNPGSNSREGNKAMELTPRGLFTGGDGNTQGGYNVGRVAFYDFNTVPASNGVETTITEPIEGRVVEAGVPFTIRGTATAPGGVQRVEVDIRDRSSGRYLNDDLTTWGSTTPNTFNATLAGTYASFRVQPDVIGATNATWSFEVTVPYEGRWGVQARATDTAGQGSLDTSDREWLITSTGQSPTVAITQPVAMNPPVAVPTVVLSPGQPLTFRGKASDDEALNSVEIQLRNSTTRENLAADGTWGIDAIAGWHRISPTNLNQKNFDWTFTTPFNLTPGTYSFTVRAADQLGLSTSSADQGKLTLSVQIPGDAPPDGRLSTTGTVNGLQSLNPTLTGTATDDKGVAEVRVARRTTTRCSGWRSASSTTRAGG